MGRHKVKIIKKKCKRSICNNVFEYKDTKKARVQKYCNSVCMHIANGENNKGKIHSEEHNKKISNAVSGEKNPFYGKKHTKEVKERIGIKNKGNFIDRFGEEKANEIKAKISDGIRGEKNPFYGKHLSEEHKKKVSQNHANMSGSNNPMYGKGYLVAGEKNGCWKGGVSFKEYGLEWNDELRTKVRKRDNFVCQICSKNGYIVHHIDYIKKHNYEENLITTCNNCHGKTNFNREYWLNLLTEKIKVIYGNN